MRSLVVVVLAAVLLAGCTSRVGGAPEGSGPDDGGPRHGGVTDLAVPIELRPVLESGSTGPTVLVLPSGEGEQLTMAAPILTIRRLDGIRTDFEETAGVWVLNLDLSDDDGAAFGDWTADHIGERLAMVADDEVLTAPRIQAAIPGGEIQIAGNYTRDEAEALLGKITGQ